MSEQTKPTIFFSHSAGDQEAIARLKELFVAKTGGAIDVFVSSDGESLPVGRNWVHQVEQALDRAGLMLVFMTPNSLGSDWVNFEAGYAYAKKIKVVPVGFLGVDLGTLGEPLSLLQGFNINSEAGLNNLIAVANEEFGHKHAEGFSKEEFARLVAVGGGRSESTFGKLAYLFDDIIVNVAQEDLAEQDFLAAIRRTKDGLKDAGIAAARAGSTLQCPGMQVEWDKSGLRVQVDPGLADVALPNMAIALATLRGQGVQGATIRLVFQHFADFVRDRHKRTGRLYGAAVTAFSADLFSYRSLRFELSSKPTHGMGDYPAQLLLTMQSDTIPLGEIRELVELLYHRNLIILDRD